MNLQEQISRMQSMMGVIKELSETTDDVVGNKFWFEYHCFESPKSCDAELWYRTHNKVLVLSIVELGCGDTKLERLLEGCPRVYRVVFEDGFEYDVFEDELMESKEEFERPDAPKRNQQEQISRIRSMMGIVTETRQGMFNWLKEKLPNTPEYVIRDWVYKMIKQSDDVNTYEGITEWIDEYVKDIEWEFQKDFPISMDIFTDKTKKELESRIQGEVRQDVDKDTERHETQKELLQSKGISEEPIILFKTKDGKYELGEGWHRTTQTFIQYPDGFIQPNVYIGLNAKWLD
jgi:hypothetical protein